jgi:hypothetical protein
MKSKVNISTLLANILAITTAAPKVNPVENTDEGSFSGIFKAAIAGREDKELLARKEAFTSLVERFAPTTVAAQNSRKERMRQAKNAYLRQVQELKLYDHCLQHAMETGNFFPLLKAGHPEMIGEFCEVLGVSEFDLAEDCFLVPELETELVEGSAGAA